MTWGISDAILRRLMPVLCGSAVLGATLALWFMQSTDWRGDEYTYADMAGAIAGTLRGSQAPGDGWAAAIFGTGWFMPGMGVTGAVPFLFDPEPPRVVLRGWALTVNLALGAWLVRCSAQAFGRLYAVMLLVFPGMTAAWYFSAASYLPELTAGLLSTLALLAAWRCAMALTRGEAPRWHDVLAMEALLVAALYLRGPVLLLAVAVHGFLLVTALHSARAAAWRLMAGAAAFALALLPWSLAASAHFGAPVVTTTNVPLVLADGFGDPGRTCFGPCGEGDDIWPAWHFAQGEAARTGENALAIERRMMRNSLEELGPREYLRKVRGNFGRLLLDPLRVVRTFEPVMYRVPPDLREPLVAMVGLLTWVLYTPMLLALLATNILSFRGSDNARVQSLLIKLATLAAFVQPFVHKSSGRYWAGFAPLMAWSAALLASAWLLQKQTGVAETASAILDRVQVVYGCLFALCGAAILLA